MCLSSPISHTKRGGICIDHTRFKTGEKNGGFVSTGCGWRGTHARKGVLKSGKGKQGPPTEKGMHIFSAAGTTEGSSHDVCRQEEGKGGRWLEMEVKEKDECVTKEGEDGSPC